MNHIKRLSQLLARRKLRISFSLVALLSVMTIVSCSEKKEEAVVTEAAAEEADVKFVELNATQFKAADIEYQPIQQKNLSDILEVTGVLDAPPQSLISINTPYGGFLKKTSLLEGSSVRKGEVIAVLEHPDYIQFQQDYLQNYGELEFLEKEYNRQKELQKENVASDKVLQRAEADYKRTYAIVKGLESKLKLIGINPSRVLDGIITSEISVTSPINGYVTKVNANIGKYVNAQDVIFEIVDLQHIHVELTVFEKDISKIKEGQRIRFTLANNPTVERTAKVYLIGRSFDESRSVRIHGHLDAESTDLMPGMYVNAKIEIESEKALVVPKEAVVLSDGKEFIFVRNKDCALHPECSAHELCALDENCKEHPDCEAHEKCREKVCKEHSQCQAHGKETGKELPATDYYTFSKIQVKTGISDGVFIEIIPIEEIPEGSQVVNKGAFSLLSKTKMSGQMDACGH